MAPKAIKYSKVKMLDDSNDFNTESFYENSSFNHNFLPPAKHSPSPG